MNGANKLQKAGYRPRRSCLYMPGSNARALDKARSLTVDTLIFDLEDAVAPEAKEAAREQVMAVVGRAGFGRREVIVRVNDSGSPWGEADLAAAIAAKPDGILMPKIKTADDVAAVDRQLTLAGAGDDVSLWIMIETPQVLLELRAIAALARQTRLAAMVMGTNDLAKELGARFKADRAPFQMALSLTLAAARSAGLVAIDGVYNAIDNAEGFAAECAQGRDLGFDGKTLIHPSQIEDCNRIFTPDHGEVAHARAVIDAFEDPANARAGVIRVNGKMTELLHLDMARKLVAIDDAIAKSMAA